MQNLILSPVSIDELTAIIRESVKAEIQQQKPEPPQLKEELISRKEAAKTLGVSLTTLNEWTKTGKVPAYRIASRIRYKKNEVLNSLNQVVSTRRVKKC